MRIFKEWFENFRQSINGYNFYVDFEKVYSAEVCGGKISASSPFIIAQDTSGEHTSAFESELDDLLIRRGAIGQSEIDSLRKYYF